MSDDGTAKTYETMKQTLVGFRSGTLPLSELIDRLPTLLNEAGDVDPVWREEYVGCWWTLEQVHEQAIELGEAQRMPAESRATVDDALEGLERLIDGALTRS